MGLKQTKLIINLFVASLFLLSGLVLLTLCIIVVLSTTIPIVARIIDLKANVNLARTM